MTIEEASVVLKNVASLLHDGTKYLKPEHEREFREAYEMAIKALSVDAVSRKAVLDICDKKGSPDARWYVEQLPFIAVAD